MADSDPAINTARARFMEGVAHFEIGRYSDAERAFETSLAAFPGRPSTLANLGATRLKLGRPAEALVALDDALAVAPDDIDALTHRGNALAALGRHEDAIASHDRAVALDSTRVADQFGRAGALASLGRLDDAIAGFDLTLRLAPRLAEAWSQRASALREIGRFDEAARSYEQAIASGGDTPLNRYALAALRGGVDVPGAPPLDYVEALFDSYAEGFGAHLVEDLGYRAPFRLVEGLAAFAPNAPAESGASAAPAGRKPFAAGLDLGCGSGLCGPGLALMVEHLDGLDLSSRMLDEARKLGLYRELVHADLVAYLNTTDRSFDLVVAADVLVYLGALDAAFAGVRRVITPRGVFAFTVEKADDLAAGAGGFVLQPSLRYAHSRSTIEQLATAYGFAIERIVEAPLRNDQNRPIVGFYVYLRGI